MTKEVSESGCLPLPLPMELGHGWAVVLLFCPYEYYCLLSCCPWRETVILVPSLSHPHTDVQSSPDDLHAKKLSIPLPVNIKGCQITVSYIGVFGVGMLSRGRKILPKHPRWVDESACLFFTLMLVNMWIPPLLWHHRASGAHNLAHCNWWATRVEPRGQEDAKKVNSVGN